MKNHLIYWFKDVGKDDVQIVGEKGAQLGEFVSLKAVIPAGFIISTYAYFQFIRENNLTTKINHLLSTVNFDRPESLHQVSSHIKKLIMHAEPSKDLTEEIFASYRHLGGVFKDAVVSIHPSSTSEHLSHIRLRESQADVHGEANLLLHIKEVWASLFEPRAIFYRHEKKIDHFRFGIAVVVQQMIESEKSGVIFTQDPVTNNKNNLVIEAIFGLGEYHAQDLVSADQYEVDKKELKVLHKRIAVQEKMLIKTGKKQKEVKLAEKDGARQKLTENQILELAMWGKKLETHFYFPQHITWAIVNHQILLIESRPLTAHHAHTPSQEHKVTHPVYLSGSPAAPGIKSGPVRILTSIKDIKTVLPGDVLVIKQTHADYIKAMKKAAAIITESGGRTSHAALAARELGIPAVVGVEKVTTLLKPDTVITVNGTKGEIHKGSTVSMKASSTTEVPERQVQKTATHVYVNLAESELAEHIAQKHIDGVGLLRSEFMIGQIGVHPKKMIRDGKKEEFISALADQIEIFCKAFSPRPVVYRASDFKTNDYRSLTGGKDFEPHEENPLLGYRGTYRYMHDPEVFEMELEAIKRVRNKKGLKNLWLMLPFVRNVKELQEVRKIISAAGLYRSPTFRLWMMVEVPANVILLERFIAAGIDGVSIGTTDLTMLMLGVDRDNSEVAHEFNELDESVLWAMEHVIKTCHKHHITSSICGQTPSLYPDLLEKLVRWGITSVSINPDVIDSVRQEVARVEKKILLGR